MSLRPYQLAAREAVRGCYLRGQRAALVVLPTGTGKTRTALSMCADTVRRGRRVLWLAHRSELIEQPVSAWRGLPELDDAGRAGIVMAGTDEADADMVCASVQTLARGDRLARVLAAGVPALVVVDEAHHSAAGQWRTVLERVDAVAAERGALRPWHLGLTATPERTDRADLSEMWGEEPAYVYTYQEAIADGYLCEPRFTVDRLVMDAETEALLAKASADDDDAEMARLLLRAGVVDHTVAAVQRHAVGRHSLVFTADVAQAHATRGALVNAGIRAAVVSGETPAAQRRAILRAFSRGEVDAICNCAVLTEGTDLPICDSIVLARPFSSKPLYVQAVGRGLRLYPDKADCRVVDLVGASVEHSMIMAAALLPPGEGKPRPFVGILRRSMGGLRAPVRVAVEPDGDGWVVVAMVVGDGARAPVEPFAVDVPEDVEREEGEGGKVSVPNMWRDRRPVLADWVRVGDGAWACDAGSHGLVMLVDLGDGWMSYLYPRSARKPRPMGRRPTTEEVARSLGDDLFRQASALVGRNAAWKDKPATDAAVNYASRLGLSAHGMTAGEVSRAIAEHKGRQRLRSTGLDGFRAVLGER